MLGLISGSGKVVGIGRGAVNAPACKMPKISGLGTLKNTEYAGIVATIKTCQLKPI